MTKNLKIEQIETGEAAITDLSEQESRMRTLYMQDGVIDDTEQDALDRIGGKIRTVQTRIAALRAEVERNRGIWESHASAYAYLQNQAQELTDFGHADAPTVHASLEPIPEAVTDQRWADATAAFEQAEANIIPVWEDYELKKAAKLEYEPLRADYENRLSEVERTAPYPEAMTAQIVQLRGNVPAIDAAAVAGEWPDALELLRDALRVFEPLEAEARDINLARDSYNANLAALQPRLTEASSSEYTSLAEQNEAMAALQTEMEAAAAAFDFDTASAKCIELADLVDTYLAAREVLDTDRAAYESALSPLEPRLRAASSSELTTTGDIQQTIIDREDEMRALAEAEDFAGALAKLVEVETALIAYEAIVDDRDLYETRLAAMQDELLEVTASRPEWAYLMPLQSAMATIQTDMETAAQAEDFTTALTKIGELEAKVVECFTMIETKHQEYVAARANLDRQVSAAESDASDAAPALDTEIAAVRTAVTPIDTAATAEDWVEAKNLIQPALDAVAAFNSVMMQAEMPGMTNGLSTSAIDLAARSPELVSSLEDLEAAGWQVVVGTAGRGSFCSRGANPTITIDANDLANDLSAVQTLAHEAGHAEYNSNPDTSTRENYVNDMLADEGAATMENIRVQREILENGGADIGIAGRAANHPNYNAAFDQYLIDGDAEACRNAMGQIFGQGETTSNTGEPYEDYYGGFYDRHHTVVGRVTGALEDLVDSVTGSGDPSSPDGHGHTH